MSKGFNLKFTIEGVPELSRKLLMVHKRLTNFKKPLWKSSRLILADVERNFETEGGLVGGWQPLTGSVVAERMRKGYGGKHPILQRTGALRRSFYANVDSKRAFISSKSPYYGFHQSIKPRTKLPRRAMLVLVDRTKQNIIEEFNKFIRFK